VRRRDYDGLIRLCAEQCVLPVVEIALRIAEAAAAYGIKKKDIVVDPLALSVSSDGNSANVTLAAVKAIREAGFRTVLGVSNISFGLPAREKINAAFFTSAMERGLNCAIMNPFTASMMDAWYAFKALHGMDPACEGYIAYADQAEPAKTAAPEAVTLHYAIVKGMKQEAAAAAALSLAKREPLEVINQEIIPALTEIGEAFEQKKAYLPQLLMSADAATAAFEQVKEKMPAAEESDKAVILATVKGDIHDIGKNIVRVLLESYGFKVYDLGRDVEPEAIVEAASRRSCRLVGLSALMTTTVPAMEETVRLLHEADPAIRVMVGGAVLNPDYAEDIRADYYGKDAMEAVRIAKSFYQN